MSRPTPRLAKPPKIGPLVAAEWDAKLGEWKVTLTAAGRAELEAWLVKWPTPAKLLLKAWPSLFRRAVELGHTFEELDAECMAAVTVGMTMFEPARGFTFTNFASWRIRGDVSKLVNKVSQRAYKSEVARGHATAADEPDADPMAVIADRPEYGDDDLDRSQRFLRLEVRRILRGNGLNFRDREIFALRRGLRDGTEWTLQKVAKVFGLSKERVRQIEKEVLSVVTDDLGQLHAACSPEGGT